MTRIGVEAMHTGHTELKENANSLSSAELAAKPQKLSATINEARKAIDKLRS